MKLIIKYLASLLIVFAMIMPLFVQAGAKDKRQLLPAGKPVLWNEPADLTVLNLYYGPGGAGAEPHGSFKFVKETKGGTQIQFVVSDERENKWRVKLGDEAQPETVATRLLWAVGYFVDETYYLPEMRVDGINGHLSTAPDGSVSGDRVYGARLERDYSEEEFIEWNWFDNPFVGTEDLDGLRIMMALMNNWDLKDSNNRIAYDKENGELRYMIHDIGACFGRTGGISKRSKNDVKDYVKSKFIKKVKGDYIDLVLESRPHWLLALNPSYYSNRSKMEKIGKKIPIAHAQWIGQLLSQLSDEQIADAFRAAHYSPEEVRLFTDAVRMRINELANL
jgi:hypothetical protein